MRTLLEYGWGTLLPYALLLLLYWRLGSAPQLPFVASASLGGLLLWACFYRHYRHVADTPTATTRAAAQGYTECYGAAAAPGGKPLLSPYGKRPCLWYHAECQYQGREYQQRHRESHRSDDAFRLLDQRGEVVVLPAGALVDSRHQQRWRDGDYRYTEHWIAAGDPLYVLGELQRAGEHPRRQDFRDDLQLTLNQWKDDQHTLLRRFDRNGDGQLSAEEWEQARQAAQTQVQAMHRELAAAPLGSQLQQPADGRPFIISWRSPQDTARRLRRLAWCHAALATLAALHSVKLLLH
ncbi:EF-hand domain-containing protein [Vogesella facilis]|uniref:EF-hand domain-containing protein n=1 Tax=Vogesella facilis TaxID=1655232 RepID=A0ABV7RBT4_9NEIS